MVVLATKVYVAGDAGERAVRSLDALVRNTIGELSVEWTIGVRHDDFPTVTITGEDAPVARAALREEWGEITTEYEPGTVGIGTLESWDDSGWTLDAGTEIRIAEDDLELGPGSPAQLIERFGLVQHQRLEFVAGEEPVLAPDQVDALYEWQRGPGRLNVNCVTRGEVRSTLNRAGHAQDVITIERLGLLEQSVICTDDTDPPGLLAAVGKYLPGEMRCVISQ